MNIKNYLLSAVLLFAAGTIYGFDNVTSSWTVYSCSSEASGEEGSNVLDDNDQTNWHTQWRGGTDPYPHSIVFLSDGTISLSAITILPRQNSTYLDYNPRSVQISASDDGENWSDIGTYAFANDRLLKTFIFPETITPHYIRLYFAEGYRTYLALAEIDFFLYSSEDNESIDFEDSNVKDICVQNWDINGDGELQKYEAGLVTDIGTVFRGNTNITSFRELSFFVSLTNIGTEAFMGCSNLEEVTLPNGIQSCSARSFKGCTKLSSIHIPSDISFIVNSAFEGCTGLDNDIMAFIESVFDPIIQFEDSAVKTICVTKWDTDGDGELSRYSEAAKVTTLSGFENSTITSFNELQYFTGLTAIGSSAFSGCSNLTSITLPDGVTSIGDNAFWGCSSLTSITLPDDVTSIGRRAFLGCSLTSITLPDGITSIGESAFKSCKGLTSVTLPDDVTSIEESVFDNCQNLRSIAIPDEVTSIGNNAFWGCSSLTSITIGNSVTSIAENTFNNCSSLRSIHFTSTTPKVTYTSWGSNPVLFVPDSAIDAYKTAWPDYTARIVPESMSDYVYNITVYAQNNASDVIAKIGEINALKVVNLKVKGSINSYDVIVFRDKMLNLCNLDLSEATIVASEQTYYSQTYKTKNNVFTGYMVPSTLLSLVLPTSITAVDADALLGCRYLSSIIIPEGVTTIGGSAFSSCSNLQSISIPESVTSIGSSAFYYCSNLQSITLPTDLTEISHGVFWGCKKFTSISLPNGITTIGTHAFDDCYNLSTIDLPKDLTSIGDYAFSSCGNLTSIDLPKGLKSIGSYAFGGCSNLTQVKIPPYVESMGGSAFEGCSKLNTIYVYIPDYTLNINESAFSTYYTAELRIPGFLYRDYYYNEGGWKRFINIVPCNLEPGDYEILPTNSDTSISGNDEVIPKIDEDTPIDGEINSEGSITVTPDVDDEHPQEFDTVDQIIDGEGQGGSLIGEDDGENQGNLAVNTLRVKINVKAGRWYFFCFPYDVTIANCTYPGQYAWRYYDGAYRATNGSGGWKPVTGSTLTALQGYAFQTSHTGNLIISFNAPTFGGDRPKTLVAHASGNAANASWNFVGNPYSSFYDFIATDFSSPVTVYNSGTGTYTAFRPGDDDLHLEPYQAFFVQKPEETAAILFDADRRESYRQGQAKMEERAQVRRMQGITPERRLINLEILDGETTMDKTRVVLNEKKSRDYELDCDASKFLSNEAVAQLYSIENGINMAINERPLQGDIRLGYTAKKAGRFSIGAPRMDMPMVLVDTKLNTTFDLSLGTYDFDSDAGSFNDRFLLRPSDEATAINAMTAKTGVCIGKQDGGIAIGGAEGKTINVYTTSGAQSAQHDGNGFIALKRGVYVVSVDGVTAKVSVK